VIQPPLSFDPGPGGCCMLCIGFPCPGLAVASCVIGCEGERVREREFCTNCVAVLRFGVTECIVCPARHSVQLLQVTWLPDADVPESLRTLVRTETVGGE
jgi:hypothetical protein